MKIPLTSGNVVDTDNLNDRDAALHEAINNLYLVCEKFNVPALAKVVIKDNEGLGMLYLPNKTDEERSKEYGRLVASIADWLYKTSDGRLAIFDTDGQNPESQENP